MELLTTIVQQCYSVLLHKNMVLVLLIEQMFVTSMGNIYLELDLSCPMCISCQSVDGYVGSSGDTTPVFNGIWRQYNSLEFEDQMGEVSFDLDSVTVSVTERKLRLNGHQNLHKMFLHSITLMLV